MSTFAAVLRTSACCTLDDIVDNFEIFQIIMVIMVKWRGRLGRGWAEDGKLQSHLEWPKANASLLVTKLMPM